MLRKTFRIFIILLLLGSTAAIFAAEIPAVPKTDSPPDIDGKLDDAAWKAALEFNNFKTIKPDYGKDPAQKTVSYIVFDEENIYFAVRCFDTRPDKIKAAVSARDAMFQDDYVMFVLDPFNTMQEGFGFFMNPLGIQGDGMVTSEGNLNPSFDMIWDSKGLIDKQGYVVECRIPLKSIRFPKGDTITMRMGVFRQVVRNSEMSSSPPMFADKGSLIKQARPVSFSGLKYKRVVELLPAVTHRIRQSHKEGAMQTDEKQTDISLTGKVGLTSDLTLDAAVNPDFSQVEADAGQIDVNLRYELFYPEKRPFFLEGNELFRFAGNVEEGPLAMLVHTRRIVDPVFGFKLTGKVGRKNTLAAIYAQDNLPDDSLDVHPDFSIVRFKHAMKEESYIGGFYTSKEYGEGYNRVVGGDGLYRINSVSTASFHLFGSFTQRNGNNVQNNGHALGLNYKYGTRTVILDLGYQDISKHFLVDTGFATRTGLRRLSAFAMYRFYPKSDFFQRVEPFYWSFHLYDTADKMMETFNLFTLRTWLPGNSQFRVDAILSNEVYAGQRFNTSGIGIQGRTQFTKQVFVNIFFRHTGSIYYDPAEPFQGYGSRVGSALVFQPMEKLKFSLSLSYADFYSDADKEKQYDYTIIRSRNTFQVNKYLFVRAIAEYNTFQERLTLDGLISFTYIPGTVMHVGYGSAYEKMEWTGQYYRESNRFFPAKRGFFFKVSYLWRF